MSSHDAFLRTLHLVGIGVYEFLHGERQIGLEYVEALLAAVDLEVRRRNEVVPDARSSFA